MPPSPPDPAVLALRRDLGARIRALRTRRRGRPLTLAEVGRAAGVSASFVSQIERGVRGAPVEVLADVAHALGVPLAALFAEEGNRRGAAGPRERLAAFARDRRLGPREVERLARVAQAFLGG